MAFTPEDGTGLPNSNSYEDVSEFESFHADRGNDVLSYSAPEKEQALVNATDYIDKRFGRNFRGWKQSKSQALEWPRIDAFDNSEYTLDGVPAQLKNAVSEYALLILQLQRNLAPPPTPEFSYLDVGTGESVSQGAGRVTKLSEKVGPIETETGYEGTDKNSRNAPVVDLSMFTNSIPQYPQADLWIEELVENVTTRELARG